MSKFTGSTPLRVGGEPINATDLGNTICTYPAGNVNCNPFIIKSCDICGFLMKIRPAWNKGNKPASVAHNTCSNKWLLVNGVFMS